MELVNITQQLYYGDMPILNGVLINQATSLQGGAPPVVSGIFSPINYRDIYHKP